MIEGKWLTREYNIKKPFEIFSSKNIYIIKGLLLKSVRYLFDIGYFIYPNMNTYIDVVP